MSRLPFGDYFRAVPSRTAYVKNQNVPNRDVLKMAAADGKQRLTDVADTGQLLRLIQSIPSPKT